MEYYKCVTIFLIDILIICFDFRVNLIIAKIFFVNFLMDKYYVYHFFILTGLVKCKYLKSMSVQQNARLARGPPCQGVAEISTTGAGAVETP